MEEHHDSLLMQRHHHDRHNNDDNDQAKGEYGMVQMMPLSNSNSNIADGQDGLFPNDYSPKTLGCDSDSDDDDGDHKDQVNHGRSISRPHQQSTSNNNSQPLPLSGWQRMLLTPILPDDRYTILGVPILDGVPAVRCFKFFVITLLGLVGMFHFVRWMNFEHDSKYTIHDMILYDGQPILMDTMFFFVVGRLYKQRGIDHLAWLGVMLLSGVFTSMETLVPFLQNSVSLYSMYCIWPAELWVFAAAIVALCAVVGLLHIRYVFQKGMLGVKIMELVLTVILFLLPPMSSPYFHFHHWYAGWLIGMHCNFDEWWSRLTMAWCWGAYINGIAVYGRDPLLTCGYSFYLSVSLWCPYLTCYIDELRNHTHSDIKIMEAQDWWNCSATDYVP